MSTEIKPAPFRCRVFRLHKWSAYSPPYEWLDPAWQYTKLVQDRTCTLCGKVRKKRIEV